MLAKGLCSAHYQSWKKGHRSDLQAAVDQYVSEKSQRRKANAERNFEQANARRRGARQRNKTLLERYGITSEDWQQMFVRQGGACNICSAKDKPLVVDHCHHSRRVRGLLCHGCNTLMGILDNKSHLFHRAILHQIGSTHVEV